MDHALELGLNFFDTADRYGGETGSRATEEMIPRWHAQGGDRREKVVLGTKLFGPDDRVAMIGRSVRRPHPPRLPRQPAPAEDGSRRPVSDAPRRPDGAVGGGLAGDGHADPARASSPMSAAATSPAERIARANEACPPPTLGLVIEQSHYNLLVRTVELEVLPARMESRRWPDPVEPAVERAARRRARRLGPLPPPVGAVTEADREAASEAGAVGEAVRQPRRGAGNVLPGLAEIAVQPARSSALARWPLTAPRSAPLEITLGPDTLTAIDAIFPGPGGTAPEAYAW